MPHPLDSVRLGTEAARDLEHLKIDFKELWDSVESCPMDPRYKALVKTKLEEAHMFANKGISRADRG